MTSLRALAFRTNLLVVLPGFIAVHVFGDLLANRVYKHDQLEQGQEHTAEDQVDVGDRGPDVEPGSCAGSGQASPAAGRLRSPPRSRGWCSRASSR